MQPLPAAVVLWILLFSLDFLSAQQPKPKLGDTNAPNEEPGAKRNQPHIIFILIDDQVCKDALIVEACRGRTSTPQLYKLPQVRNPDPDPAADHILLISYTQINWFSQSALFPLATRFIPAGSFLLCCYGFSYMKLIRQ